MHRAVLISVRLHDLRFHGLPEWPPSPSRLFQALVAGVGLSGPLGHEETEALRWLEKRDHPVIASPTAVGGQRPFRNAVPNNDLDSVGGDLQRIAKIRTWKVISPHLLHADLPLLYAWPLSEGDDDDCHARAVCAMADRLYQFGRGVDMAWAWGEVLNSDELEDRLSAYPGIVYRPSGGGRGRTLACPKPGSLDSLVERHAANSRRFRAEPKGRGVRIRFSQAPKPRFAQVPYDSPPSRRLYTLRDGAGEGSFGVWPLSQASALVVLLRDRAVEWLRQAMPDRGSEIELVLVGRKADGADAGPTALRVKIVSLPSIGHAYADHAVRRVLVEVPAGCPLRADDVHWAFSRLEPVDAATGEILDLILTPSEDDTMLTHYGITGRVRSRVWRTVTPAALPESARRRRIDPARLATEAKHGPEPANEQARAASGVVQALRHAGLRTRVKTVRVQREPFEAKGERAETFAPGTRFSKYRLWHVEITFQAPIAGPLVIGDGRFLGLGLMAPLRQAVGVHVFAVEDGLAAAAQPAEVSHALRRAVMARVQEVLGARTSVPAFFTGHNPDGSPAQTERHPHLTFTFDPRSARLLVVAPHVIHQRPPTREETRYLGVLETALIGFRELRAGAAGSLTLRAAVVDFDTDPLFGTSRTWESVTPYQVTRHLKRVGAAEALSADLLAECRRRGLPQPRITAHDMQGVPGVGLVGSARLAFEVGVAGPLILGKSRYRGGGLFTGMKSASA